ncbi:CdaR family protein [[Clostridium] colinum]|uniref:CdaR family protein n=1 Tax=[Clostridium] colinum TaxID=36835 RepID=UPI002024D524|nr:CdaR family protein [[Clostridium] colinum]
MYKKIKYFFTNNLYWKALSVLLAIGLWFVVMNINNPTEIKSFTLNISLLNEEKLAENDISILNIDEIKSQKAEIKIKGTRTTLDELSKKVNRDNIKLALDLDQVLGYNIGDEPLEVVANLKPTMPNIPYPNNNFEIVSFYPNTCNVYLDKIVTIPKKIHPKTVGETRSGYIAYEPEISSEYIQVTGPKSIIDKIQVIYAEIDITDQTSTITKNVIPVAYDKNGNKITDIKFNIEEVSIKVPIILQGVINIIEPNLIGQLPDGFIIDSISYKPKVVEVVGDTNNLKKLTKLNLPDIDISGLTESTEYTYDILPILNQYNLKLKNHNNSQIKIYINIKKATTKQLTIPTSNISILGYNDSFFIDMPEEFSINIVGEDNFINNIDVSKIKFSIDVTDLKEGSYNIKINTELPEGVEIVSQPYMDIKISNKAKEDISEPISNKDDNETIENTTLKEKEVIESTTITE